MGLYTIGVIILIILNKESLFIRDFNEALGTNMNGYGIYYTLLFVSLVVQVLLEVSNHIGKLNKKSL